MRQKLINQFGTITAAAAALGYTRPQIYNFINTGLSDKAKDRIRGRGYNPETFEPLKHLHRQDGRGN